MISLVSADRSSWANLARVDGKQTWLTTDVVDEGYQAST